MSVRVRAAPVVTTIVVVRVAILITYSILLLFVRAEARWAKVRIFEPSLICPTETRSITVEEKLYCLRGEVDLIDPIPRNFTKDELTVRTILQGEADSFMGSAHFVFTVVAVGVVGATFISD